MRPQLWLYAYFSLMAFCHTSQSLQDFGGGRIGLGLSQDDFDKLCSGEEEASLEVGLKSWIKAGRWSGEVCVHMPQNDKF